jgi:phospholipid-binding lipoprotein MlaA
MKSHLFILLLIGILFAVTPSVLMAAPRESSLGKGNLSDLSRVARSNDGSKRGDSSASGESEAEEPPESIPDPLEPVNRLFFRFNDRLYFWILKPAASGYKAVFPEPVRVGVSNFFSNLTTPIRFVNCLLQGNLKGAGNETFRLLLNSTLGLAGFLDPAKKELQVEKEDEDFGQTLGTWGIGPILYVEWPFLGASSLRDSVGYVGDLALDPRTYLITSIPVNLGIRSFEEINDHSLILGEYEALIKASLDPYVAKRDAFSQYRRTKIKEKGKGIPPAAKPEPKPPKRASRAHQAYQEKEILLGGY